MPALSKAETATQVCFFFEFTTFGNKIEDAATPVKTEEFTVYEEDGSVHAKFRAVTRLDGTVEWTQWSEAADRWTPATVIDEKIQKRDNISNEEAIKVLKGYFGTDLGSLVD